MRHWVQPHVEHDAGSLACGSGPYGWCSGLVPAGSGGGMIRRSERSYGIGFRCTWWGPSSSWSILTKP
jgi:hypothetical protein